MVRIEALSFPGLLEDPLIRMMMASDGVSAGEFRDLMAHMREVVTARADTIGHLQPEQIA